MKWRFHDIVELKMFVYHISFVVNELWIKDYIFNSCKGFFLSLTIIC